MDRRGMPRLNTINPRPPSSPITTIIMYTTLIKLFVIILAIFFVGILLGLAIGYGSSCLFNPALSLPPEAGYALSLPDPSVR